MKALAMALRIFARSGCCFHTSGRRHVTSRPHTSGKTSLFRSLKFDGRSDETLRCIKRHPTFGFICIANHGVRSGDLSRQTPVELRVQLGDEKGVRRFFPEKLELETESYIA